MSIKVSIIIPVYNVQEYLDKCLDSVCKQSLKDIEIILVNDGSSDKSLQIAEEFARKDSRIVLHTQQNQGQGIARNWGIEKAKGEFIGFIDSDDFVDTDMYKILYDKAVETGADIVQSSPKKVATKAYYEKIVAGGVNAVRLFSEDLLHPTFWSKIYRRGLFIDNNIRFPLEPVRMKHQDFAIAVQPMFYAQKIVLLNKQLYYYREFREGSVTNTCSDLNLEHLNIALEINRNFLLSNNCMNQCSKYYNNLFTFHALHRLNNILIFSPISARKRLINKWIDIYKHSEYYDISSGKLSVSNKILNLMAMKYPLNWLLCTIAKFIIVIPKVFKKLTNKELS